MWQRLLFAASLVSIFPTLAAGQDASKPEAWVSLFNGRDLDGWTPKIKGHALGENFGQTFRVENGVLKVAYDQYPAFNGQFGHLFYKAPFSTYKLRIEYRFIGNQCPGGPTWAVRNSGVMIHCQPPETMRQDQDFPVSIEVQFLGGDGEHSRSTGNLCTPGTHVVIAGELIKRHCTNSSSQTYHGDQWVTVEAHVLPGGKVKHLVNGQTVLEYEQPQLDDSDKDAQGLIKNGERMLHGGYLALQAESHPIEFRKVEILPLE
ncbi:MAG: DUF1080 domain-containing protein [Planctomycetes bacterium]|nr:DUF1080 domain-containing protein [Planctomycetota bacterium]